MGKIFKRGLLALAPLAISIAFGLMASTALILFVIPCLYAILADLSWVTSTENQHSGLGVDSTTQAPEHGVR